MKYLFFDIDGTLLSHTEGISPTTIQALKLAKENGHKIFICTGRSYAEVPIAIYKFDFDGVIAAAGAYVRVGDEVIYNKIMPENLIDNIIEQITLNDIPYVLEGVEDAYSHNDAIAMSVIRDEKLKEIKERTKYEHSAYDYRVLRGKSIADYYNERGPISKMTLLGNGPQDYVEIEKFIDKDYYLIKYERYAELVPNGINKFTGIEKVLKYLDAKVEDTFGFGDSLNDLEMLKFTNIGVAVGNASEAVKEVADYVTEDIHNDGIYRALKKFQLI